ncbi:MAG: tetratricopeptide repeat protein [Betaproteobacteria bacterium]|nr:tetratricopeptide repeat protein [Betaproteobacteria bacterium]
MLTSSFARSLRICGSTLLIAALGWTAPATAGPAEDTKEATRLYQQGKLDQALTKINAALAQQPKDAQGRFIKGLILTEQKKPADAIQVFTSLTEDYPELPEPYNNLAVLYASQGNYDKAKAALELAIHTHPSYATAYENLGDIYAQLARRSYDKVLQLDKTNTTAQSKLAMVKDLFSPPKNIAVASADPAKATPTTVAVTQTPTKAEPAKSTPSKPEPPAKAEPAKAATKPAGSADEQVKATVLAWAKAWAGKDVPGYLAFYAPDFDTPDGLSRAAWEAQRKDRIDRPKSISVDLKISKVTIKGDEATAVFRQTYRSDTSKSNNTKTLKLIRSGDKWLIRSERAGA